MKSKIDLKTFFDFDKIMKTGIYAIVNTRLNRVYVGESINVFARMQGHKSMILQADWKDIAKDYKDNQKNFKFIILELMKNPTKRQLRGKEGEWIAKFIMDGYSPYNKIDNNIHVSHFVSKMKKAS